MLEECERGFVDILNDMVAKECVTILDSIYSFVDILNDMVAKGNNK